MELNFQTQLSSIQDIDKLLIEADMTLLNKRRNAMIIGQAHLLILQMFPTLTFRFIEYRYRSLASQTFLLGAPKSDLPSHLTPIMVNGQPADYWVWVEVNGSEEAAKLMQKWNIVDKEDNAKRLEKCGFVTVAKH